MINKQTVTDLALERIAERDPSLYIVSLVIGAGNKILLEIDKEEGSVSIEDCMSVSRNIEHNLDREVDDFSLEVSSAGIDQPFRVLKQYYKNIGKEVKIILLENNKSLEGILKSVTEEEVVIQTNEKKKIEGRKKKEVVIEDVQLKYSEIKETKLIISF